MWCPCVRRSVPTLPLWRLRGYDAALLYYYAWCVCLSHATHAASLQYMCSSSGGSSDTLGTACRDALRDAIARDMPMALPLRVELEAMVAVRVVISR